MSTESRKQEHKSEKPFMDCAVVIFGQLRYNSLV